MPTNDKKCRQKLTNMPMINYWHIEQSALCDKVLWWKFLWTSEGPRGFQTPEGRGDSRFSILWGLRHALCRWLLLFPRGCHLGALVRPFWHLGGVAPWENLGGPWEQQDGLYGVRYRIFMDLEVILGVYFERSLGTEAWNFNLSSGLFPGHFLYRLLTRHFNAWGS